MAMGSTTGLMVAYTRGISSTITNRDKECFTTPMARFIRAIGSIISKAAKVSCALKMEKRGSVNGMRVKTLNGSMTKLHQTVARQRNPTFQDTRHHRCFPSFRISWKLLWIKMRIQKGQVGHTQIIPEIGL
jgi:hypothetical protein